MSSDSSHLPSESGGSPDDLTQMLLGWLREYFHQRLLINAGEEYPEAVSVKGCAILFTVRLRYLRGYKELWLLNEGGQRGCDRILTGAQYEELHKQNRLGGGPYNPIYVDIKLGRPEEGNDTVTWQFEGGEVLGGECGAGYAGTVVYGRVQQSFSWGGPLRQTWIS